MNFHMLIMSTQLAFKKKVFSMLGQQGSGLSQGQPKILFYLGEHDGCVQKEIASACEIEPATVTNLLFRMEESGLITRKSLNGDRRSLYVFLTNKGKREEEQVRKIFNETEEMGFEGFTLEEKVQFLSMLSRMNKNILSKTHLMQDENL